MSTEAARTEIQHDDPRFEGRLVRWYKALVDELGAASKAASAAKQPLPNGYSFQVPEDSGARMLFMTDLLGQLDRSLASQSKYPMTPEQIKAVLDEVSKIMPLTAVESDSFPTLMRLRVDVTQKLVQAGFVEALACIMRAQLKRGEALSAAQALGRNIWAQKGEKVAIKDLDPSAWSDIVGLRIVTEDDKSNTPAIVRENQMLYEKLFATSGDEAKPVLQRIVDVFNRKVDPFVQPLFPRHPEYIRVQWFNTMLKNLDRLLQRDDIEDLAAAFTDIADRLEQAKTGNDFAGAINTIGSRRGGAN